MAARLPLSVIFSRRARWFSTSCLPQKRKCERAVHDGEKVPLRRAKIICQRQGIPPFGGALALGFPHVLGDWLIRRGRS